MCFCGCWISASHLYPEHHWFASVPRGLSRAHFNNDHPNVLIRSTLWTLRYVTPFLRCLFSSAVTVRFHLMCGRGALLQTNLAVTAADPLDLPLSSQGLPTSPSRCLEVWVNTPPTHTTDTHSFFPHQLFPPLHFSLQKINTRLPPQVARGGAAGMERRRSVGSLIYLSLSGPGRPHRVFVCVSVLDGGCSKGSVSPSSAPGLAQWKPLSVSLGLCVRVCAHVCVCCNSVTVQSDILTPVLSHTLQKKGKGVDTCDGLHASSIPSLDVWSCQLSLSSHTPITQPQTQNAAKVKPSNVYSQAIGSWCHI